MKRGKLIISFIFVILFLNLMLVSGNSNEEDKVNVNGILKSIYNSLVGSLYEPCPDDDCDYFIYGFEGECEIECGECECESEFSSLSFFQSMKYFFGEIGKFFKNIFGFGGSEKTEIESEEVDEIPEDDTDICRKTCRYVGREDCPDDKWTMRCCISDDNCGDCMKCNPETERCVSESKVLVCEDYLKEGKYVFVNEGDEVTFAIAKQDSEISYSSLTGAAVSPAVPSEDGCDLLITNNKGTKTKEPSQVFPYYSIFSPEVIEGPASAKARCCSGTQCFLEGCEVDICTATPNIFSAPETEAGLEGCFNLYAPYESFDGSYGEFARNYFKDYNNNVQSAIKRLLQCFKVGKGCSILWDDMESLVNVDVIKKKDNLDVSYSTYTCYPSGEFKINKFVNIRYIITENKLIIFKQKNPEQLSGPPTRGNDIREEEIECDTTQMAPGAIGTITKKIKRQIKIDTNWYLDGIYPKNDYVNPETGKLIEGYSLKAAARDTGKEMSEAYLTAATLETVLYLVPFGEAADQSIVHGNIKRAGIATLRDGLMMFALLSKVSQAVSGVSRVQKIYKSVQDTARITGIVGDNVVQGTLTGVYIREKYIHGEKYTFADVAMIGLAGLSIRSAVLDVKDMRMCCSARSRIPSHKGIRYIRPTQELIEAGRTAKQMTFRRKLINIFDRQKTLELEEFPRMIPDFDEVIDTGIRLPKSKGGYKVWEGIKDGKKLHFSVDLKDGIFEMPLPDGRVIILPSHIDQQTIKAGKVVIGPHPKWMLNWEKYLDNNKDVLDYFCTTKEKLLVNHNLPKKHFIENYFK